MIIYVTGEDTFRSRERLKQLRDAFVKKYDPSGMNVSTLDGAGLKFEQFQQNVASQGFLSSRRFVIVDRPFEADRKTQEAIAAFIKEKSVPEETIVVFWSGGSGGEVKKKRSKDATEAPPLLAVLDRVKNKEQFDVLEPLEIEQWIVKRVKERGGSIERAAAEQLAAIVGTDLWLAANEVEKLVHQKKGAAITAADIEADIKGKLEANIFEFTDALSRKDLTSAFASLERHFASGANELYLLTMIARQLRILIGIADVAKTEPNPATIASRLSLHPFVVKKGLAQIRTFSQSELIRAHDEIVFIDHRLKNTRDNPRALLEMFVFRMCT
jgi:DNA polymerase III subunit delta